MFKRSRISLAVALTVGSLVSASAVAQEAQRVEITGSSIKRLASERALPVTVIKADDLAKAGVTNAEQAMNFIAANQSSTTTTTSVGSSTGGAAFANLRGLGDERTLVLVNGKRMVNNPYLAAAVDLNALPFGAVDRIEVLTDGASAIYGTDAIAGVINFITRKDFTGLTLSADTSIPQAKGGGERATAGISGGIGSLAEQGWNVFGGISWSQQKALSAVDRDYAKTSYLPAQGVNKTSGTSFPGNYTQPGVTGTFNPSLPGCAPPLSLPIGSICRFDYVPFINIIPEQDQLSLIARGSIAINKDNTIALEYIRANNTVSSIISPTPVTGLTMSPTNTFYPGKGITPANAAIDPTKSISLGWRQTEVGGRASEFENTTDRLLLSLEGQYKGWDYSATAFQSNADVTNTFTGGYVNSTMIRNGLNGLAGAPFLNPFGPQSAAGSAYLQSAKILGQVQSAEGKLTGVSALVSGEVYKMPAGSVMLAVGVEALKDQATYLNNFTLIRQAASSGLELAEDSTGSRRDNAISAELNIPLSKQFEVNLAVRHDRYNDVGSTTNPKASFRWQPTQALLMRGSYNTGFRAPTLYDMYAPNSITFTENPWDDPLLCPGGTVNTGLGGIASRDCGLQFQQQQGGNKALKPETSKAWSLGAAFQVTNALTLGLDYWNYSVNDSIGPTGEEVIFGDPVKYAAQFVRCSALSAAEATALAATCGAGASPNTLAYIKNQQLNLGTYNTSGIDFSAGWQGAASDMGRFNVDYKGTYVLTYEYQLEKGGVFNDNLGKYFNGNPIASYRHVLSGSWQMAAWNTQLINRYTNGYTDQNSGGQGNEVGASSTWDLAVTWSGMKNLSLTGGVTNLFDEKPQFSNQGGGFQVGYDYRYSNPIGRAFLLRGTYKF